ncbi:PAS domain S-box protein [Xanthobacteraceae bacterium Astr-EGSB]|uniref:PAS domain S-box protein n=1 Tax=Astrobacterium formosum TaxID=3069710 RepID=UPI0027B7AF7E|nr:PAS domain S-box protein [Xanthobacteraceae bacterium Astr-EGSB]
MGSETSIYQISEAQRLQLLVESVTDHAIYMLDTRGFVTSWNSGAQLLKGYSPAEAVGRHFARFFTPEDRATGLPERILRTAAEVGRAESEGLRLRKDGSRFWALAVVHAIRAADGGLIGFAKVTRDMTERRATQEALRESERRFRTLVDGVIDYAIYMLDPSGIIINWNAGAERMKGYGAQEILGQHFSRFYTREDRAGGLPARALEDAARTGRFEAEGWRVRKDGSRFWASVVIDAIRDERGDLVGFAKVTRDTTERRAAQEALRESERRFRLLVEGVSDYALYMLDPNGIVSNWNTGAERIKGYKAGDIVGQHFSRFYTEADRAAGRPAQALHTALTAGRFEAEGWRIRKDGSRFWAHVIIDPIRDETGTLIGFAKITRDITDRRESQIAQQRTQTQQAHMQRMEALGQLTGGVAHDFNNLLMIIGGHVRTVKKLLVDDPRGARAAEAIEIAAQRAESLTRQLLTYSRRQTLQPVVADVAARVEAVRQVLAGSLGPASLIGRIEPGLWPVKVDISEFELAVVNLTLNARDAMPDGGLITIAADNVALTGEETPAGLAGEFVALTVSDAGIGIAPDIIPRVFDPFFTTKGADKGTGLGLSQVHGFAHQSGGTVVLTSELGRGTRVTIYLPRATGAVDMQASHDAAPSGSGTILLVEDNPDVADVTRAMLEDLGYAVRIAHNAAEGRRLVEAEDPATGEFAAVVSDIVMAGDMDGIAFARALRAQRPALPILLATGYSEAAGAAGAEFHVLRKPYQMNDLSRALAALVPANVKPDNLVDLRRHQSDRAKKPRL